MTHFSDEILVIELCNTGLLHSLHVSHISRNSRISEFLSRQSEGDHFWVLIHNVDNLVAVILGNSIHVEDGLIYVHVLWEIPNNEHIQVL